MKINRIAEEKLAPSWAFEGVSESEFVKENYISSEEMNRVQNLPVSDLEEADIVAQREEIEKCASSGSSYHYNSQWDNGIKSALKEYAIVCGMDMSKFKEVDAEYIDSIQVLQKEASINLEGINSKEELFAQMDKKEEVSILRDPFNLDEKANTSHMDEAEWEDVTKQANLDDKPSMMSNSIIPVRGGEDYNANSYSQTARGQNSITDPDAIENFANTSEEDTGARLRRENEERASQRERNHETWQKDKVEAMEHADIIPKGKVFPTEVMNAQPGIKEDPFNFDLLPELSEGEKIASANEERRKEIQGEDKEDHEFVPQKENTRQISNDFADSLAKALGK